MFGAVQRPEAWPSFLFHETKLKRELMGVQEFMLKAVTKKHMGIFHCSKSEFVRRPPAYLSSLLMKFCNLQFLG